MKKLITFIKQDEKLKQRVLNLAIHPVKIRPRLWLRLISFFYIKRGSGSVICKSVRKDVIPYNLFVIGRNTVIEDFSTVNNMAGNVVIGENTRVGISNTIIGPVKIGDNVIIAQNVVISGLDHNYEKVDVPIVLQGVNTSEIVIGNDVWIGANAVITKGVNIGEHAVIASGCVVTCDVESGTVVGGIPARVIRKYDSSSKEWVKHLTTKN